MIGVWKVIPTLTAGYSTIIKPSETALLTLLRVVELAILADILDRVFSVVADSGASCGAVLTAHLQVAEISSAGSMAVGR